jgi:hypothetical protein
LVVNLIRFSDAQISKAHLNVAVRAFAERVNYRGDPPWIWAAISNRLGHRRNKRGRRKKSASVGVLSVCLSFSLSLSLSLSWPSKYELFCSVVPSLP